MADNQPVNNPAPNGGPATPPSVPGTPPADNGQVQAPAPLIQFDALDDDTKKYLSGQGITSQEHLNSEGIMKVLTHGRTAQQTASEAKLELDRIKGAVNPQPQTVNPFAPTPQPSTTPNPASSEPTPTPAPQTQTGALDPLSAFNLANNLAGTFPELKEDLASGAFYKNMQDLGIPLTNDAGVNITGILNYGKMAQKQAQLDAQIAELNKPNENNIPNVTPTTPQQPAADAPMTKQMAQSIAQFVASGNSHPRGNEATEFLQKSI